MPEVMVNGTKVHYLETKGRGSSHETKIIFIHGSGGNACLWKNVMDVLAGNFDSLAIDLPGHGKSGGDGMQNIAEYCEFVKEFVNALGLERIVLAGHSMGGGIALEFAVQDPSKLKAILLIGTGARLRVLPEVLERLRKMSEGRIEAKFDPWVFSEKASHQILAEGEEEWAKTTPKTRFSDMIACNRFDIMGAVGKIRVPTLIVCGREDRLTPIKYSEFLNKNIAGSKLELIEGAGHMLMLEAPQILSKVISNFLNAL